MKIFVYKTLFIFVCVFILFQLTFGIKINQLNAELEKLKSQESIENMKNKLRNVLKIAISKENYLSPDDAKLIIDEDGNEESIKSIIKYTISALEPEINDLNIGHSMDRILNRIINNHSYYIEQVKLYEKNNNFEDHYGFIYSTLGSYVLPKTKNKTNPIICKFSSRSTDAKYTNLLRTMKGIPEESKILDATGGFGKDAFEIASFHGEVKITEKVPWVHYLLNECISKSSTKSDSFPKLKLHLINNVDYSTKE